MGSSRRSGPPTATARASRRRVEASLGGAGLYGAMSRFWRTETGFFLGLWLFLMVAGRSRLFRDPGTFWHTVVGRRILASGTFLDSDPFGFTLDVIRRGHLVRDSGDRHPDIGCADRPIPGCHELACDSSDLVVANAPT